MHFCGFSQHYYTFFFFFSFHLGCNFFFFYVTTAISHSNIINPSGLYVVAEIIFVVGLEHKIGSP